MPTEIFFKNNHCEWVDVQAPSPEDLHFLHERYNINPLLLEDTTDPNHLPKFEQVDGVKFFLTRENTELERANINGINDISTKLGIFIFGKNIVTIHRLRNRSVMESRVEINQALESRETIKPEDIALKLALKIMKSFDDESKNILDTIDKLEGEIFLKNSSSSNQIRRLYKLKRKTGLNTRLLNLSTEWLENFKNLDLKDVEVVDLLDKQKDVIADFDHLNAQVTNLISMWLAFTDQKANQVMKVLAIYSMYFFPITFIAGVYGMNFDGMPELHTKYGYFITLGVMALIVVLTFIYVRRKRW